MFSTAIEFARYSLTHPLVLRLFQGEIPEVVVHLDPTSDWISMSHKVPDEPAELSAVRAMSKRIGNDLSLAQGSGGNTSIKDGNVLWVKASGTWLSEAEEKSIIVPVDLPMVNSILGSGGSDFSAATLAGELLPSIETSLHCQLPHRVVVHVHSVSGIAWSVQKDARAQLDELLTGLDWLYVPYAKPGTSLTVAVFSVLDSGIGTPDLLVLENHGLVLGGANCEAVEELLADVEGRLNISPRQTDPPDIASIESALSKHEGWRLPESADIHGIALDNSAIDISVGGALIPDHAVFLEKTVPVSDSSAEISKTLAEYRSEYGDSPDWMIIRNAGIALSSRLGSTGEAQLQGLAAIALRVPMGSNLRYIDENAAEDLRNWDAEIYRKKLDDERS